MRQMGGARLADLSGQERFEVLDPDSRVLADLLPARPELVSGRLHGQVALRLRIGWSVVEYVECSPRTAVSMLVCGTDQALVLRRQHQVGLRITRAVSVAVLVFVVAMWVAIVAPDPVAWAVVGAGPLATWWAFVGVRKKQRLRVAERAVWVQVPLVSWLAVLRTVAANPAQVSSGSLAGWVDQRIGLTGKCG